MNKNTQILVALAASLLVKGVNADVFGTGPNQFTMDFVNIGSAGNPADNTGYGAVSYGYRMGTFEVTVDQFAKAYASDNNISDNNEGIWGTPNSPASQVTFHEAAKLANWLTSGNANNGAYTISGGLVTGVDRGAATATYGVAYVVPTENEWYKAAHYNESGPGTGYRTYTWLPISTPLAGSANYDNTTVWDVDQGVQDQNGTFNMTGNIREWTESSYSGSTNFLDHKVLRSGTYDSPVSKLGADNERWQVFGLGNSTSEIGIRIAAIPEPGTMSLMGISTCGLFITRRVRRRKLAGSSLMPIRRRPNSCDVFELQAEGYEYAQDDADESNYLSILMDHMIDWSSVACSWTYKQYKSVDVMFWDKMVVSHEKRAIRSKARRASFKKKALAGFDGFLALIMK